MKTEVIMKRELFGKEISQSSKNEFFSATDLVSAGNVFRRRNGDRDFNLSQFLLGKQFLEFKKSIDEKFKLDSVYRTGSGAGSVTWVHPLVFIDIALAINSQLKVEVYGWLYDNLILFRNDSGDSYKEMCNSLYGAYVNKRQFPFFIARVADKIRISLKIVDWQLATEEQLKTRDKIHNAVKLLTNVLRNPEEAVRLAIHEYC